MYGVTAALAREQGSYRSNNLNQIERSINDSANKGKQVRSKGNQTVTDRGTPIAGPNDDADKDVFMKILVAQMANQDPMNPQDPTEYVSQLAQFASLEKLSTISTQLDILMALSDATLINSTLSTATSLIGREVEVSGEEKKEEGTEEERSGENNEVENVVGVVKSVYLKDGEVYLVLKVDGSDETVDVKYSKLLKIGEPNTASEEENDPSEEV
ncbi:flagellar hook assembly protein FlgD [Clostridioides difficile]